MEPGAAARIRRRSSLDTFVIPGRTRLPSSKVGQLDTTDIHIAECLLNLDFHDPPSKRSYRVTKPGWLDLKNKRLTMAKEKARSTDEAAAPAPSEGQTKKSKTKRKQKPALYDGRPLIIVDPKKDPQYQGSLPRPDGHLLRSSEAELARWHPHLNVEQLHLDPRDERISLIYSSAAQSQEHPLQQSRHGRLRETPHMYNNQPLYVVPNLNTNPQHQGLKLEPGENLSRPDEDDPRNPPDRPQSEGSRVTSTTRSTVSKRVLSSSSYITHNRGSSTSIEEFNVLATAYGLLPIEPNPEIMSTGMSPFVPKIH